MCKPGSELVILVAVVDIVLMSRDSRGHLEDIEAHMTKLFYINVLNEAKSLIGNEINRNE